MAAGFFGPSGAAAAATGRPTKAGLPGRESGDKNEKALSRLAGEGFFTSEPDQTENELPQPQVVCAFGLRITNWAPLTSSL